MNYYDALSKALKIIRSCETIQQISSSHKIIKNIRRRYLPKNVWYDNYLNIWRDMLSLEKEISNQLRKIKLNEGQRLLVYETTDAKTTFHYENGTDKRT